jgi:flagellar biosynthesis/type III secretory pathway M-ring protein FliF/YscJ
MKKKRNIIIVGVVVAFVVAVIAMLLIMNKNESTPTNSTNVNEVVLKDNVIVITDETDEELQPYKIDENNLYFKKNPKYLENEIVVSGITKTAPNGYIRKIVKSEFEEKTNG